MNVRRSDLNPSLIWISDNTLSVEEARYTSKRLAFLADQIDAEKADEEAKALYEAWIVTALNHGGTPNWDGASEGTKDWYRRYAKVVTVK